MRKKWKRSFVTALSVALAVGNCVPAMAASTGWKQTAAGWQYVNSNGSVQKGWFQDTDGKWYFLDYNTGVMKNGWIKPKDGKWYFMDYHTGAMKTGWIKPKDGKWYYLGASGDMKTGWLQTADGKYYYLDAASGAMQTGTITVNNQVWTLDANGVWDGKAASSVTYVSSGRPSSGGGSSSTTSDWKANKDKTFEVNKKNKNVRVIKGGTDQEPVVIDAKAVDDVVSGASKTIKDLTITKSVGDGTVKLNGLTVTGDTIVEGGGNNSIYFEKCTLKNVITKKAKESNPLRLVFDKGTDVQGNVDVTGANVILDIINIVSSIKKITASSPVVLKGNGKVDNFVITAAISIVIDGKINVGKLDTSTVENVKVEVGKDAVVSDTEGDAVITGDGTVTGYYEITLDPNGGYWLVDVLQEDGTELKDKKDLKARKLKVNNTSSLDSMKALVAENKPESDKGTFKGWASDKDGKNLISDNSYPTSSSKNVTWYAVWENTVEENFEVKSVDVSITSGSAITVDSKAEFTQSGNSVNVTVSVTTGSAVSVDNNCLKDVASSKNFTLQNVTLTVEGGTFAWKDSLSTELNLTKTYEGTFTPTGSKTPIKFIVKIQAK